jgi:hypothetical protein
MAGWLAGWLADWLAGWRCKLAALACHLTKIVNKAEELTYLYTQITKTLILT